ncbi:MFS transporter [Rhizocola hellebori]|uniref:MFS transporter n=1 Tax=Rhizocola hellebori TaxID=1392758 RepID=A0A8J3VEB6_9ACTN|nr:MFS transporter [Rhizocola hellebori]GIH03207.1 MFS transporter [Rhizocola hellebori]
MPRRFLSLAQLTSSIGDGAYVVCSVLYFTLIVGLSPAQIGLGLTLGWAVGAAAGVPLGHLADRRGPRGTAILLAVVTASAVGSFLFVRAFLPFVISVICYACGQAGLAASRQALLAGLVGPQERTRVRAHLQAMANAGLAIGAALGGVALFLGTQKAFLWVFAVDAVCFLVAALLLSRLAAPVTATVSRGPQMAVLRDRPYAVITLLNTVLMLYMPLLSLVVPLWIVQRTTAPHWMVSALLVLNTVSVVLFQVRIAGRVSGLASAARLVRLSGLVMLASCTVFALSSIGTSAWAAGLILLAAAALQVLGEMMQASGAWEISFGLAPADKQGQYQGFFGTGTAIARMLGPVLLTTLIITWGTIGWVILGLLFLTASLAMTPAVRWASSRHTAPLLAPAL